jgi:ABC-type dipeptide/oligopeptide/nickel transport system permease component
MGVLMLLAAAVVATNVLPDFVYRWADPRVRLA